MWKENNEITGGTMEKLPKVTIPINQLDNLEKTNAEIIRSMSDDELADFLIKYRENPCYVICPLFERQWNVCFLDCKAEVKKWLNAKAKA